MTQKLWKNQRGETLAETLLAVMVLTLAMTMLAGALTAAARINNSASETQTAFVPAVSGSAGYVTISHQYSKNGSGTRPQYTVSVVQFDTGEPNHYQYYRK